jgi:hypothetical protein
MFSGRLRLWFLLLLVPAECLLWRFSSHSEHSSLLLAADLVTDYDSLKLGQAATACACSFPANSGCDTLNVVEMGEALRDHVVSGVAANAKVRNV